MYLTHPTARAAWENIQGASSQTSGETARLLKFNNGHVYFVSLSNPAPKIHHGKVFQIHKLGAQGLIISKIH